MYTPWDAGTPDNVIVICSPSTRFVDLLTLTTTAADAAGAGSNGTTPMSAPITRVEMNFLVIVDPFVKR